MRPKTEGILESSLYVSDLARSIQFYETIFGFRVISDFGGRGCALEAGNRQVLLLFKKGASRAITAPHDGDGELHLAFAVGARRTAGVGVLVGGKRYSGGREDQVGARRPERLFPGSRPAFSKLPHRACGRSTDRVGS